MSTVTSMPEGHVGSLTPIQERKLQEAWTRLGAICGVPLPPSVGPIDPTKVDTTKPSGETSDDKYGQTAEFRQYLAATPPDTIRATMWGMIKCDHPDALVLRFLRARKWDVARAVVMLVSTIKWRQDANLEASVVAVGESVALKPPAEQTADDKGFMLQWRSGKSYVRGLDNDRRPVYIVKVRLHDPSAQTAQAMERFIMHTIESIRVLVKDPYDTTCLIFDLTGFGLRNMDFPAVKFIIKVFEARYPETLGVVLVHNAPLVFKGVWTAIKPLLDPVVASKIHFTKTGSDMAAFIPRAALQTEYGGDDPYQYAYVEPTPTENAQMADTAARAVLDVEREALYKEFEDATRAWVVCDPVSEEGKAAGKKREELAEKLKVSYWKLDPYLRARTFYDRTGVIGPDGDVDFARK